MRRVTLLIHKAFEFEEDADTAIAMLGSEGWDVTVESVDVEGESDDDDDEEDDYYEDGDDEGDDE